LSGQFLSTGGLKRLGFKQVLWQLTKLIWLAKIVIFALNAFSLFSLFSI